MKNLETWGEIAIAIAVPVIFIALGVMLSVCILT